MPEQAVQLLMSRVSNATPPCRVKVFPEAAQANGQPLLQ